MGHNCTQLNDDIHILLMTDEYSHNHTCYSNMLKPCGGLYSIAMLQQSGLNIKIMCVYEVKRRVNTYSTVT